MLDESGFETKHNENEKIYNQKKTELLKGKDAEYAISIANVLISRQAFSRNLARTKLFEISMNVPGCVVECGSHRGNGLGLYYNLSSTLEPTNFNRKIISFDTFEGFPSVSTKDLDFAKEGQMSDVDFNFLKEAVEINELNRVNGHIEKLMFVQGDANKTIPKFVEENPWLLVSLLYIDFDLYCSILNYWIFITNFFD